jgi:hypothetical protein
VLPPDAVILAVGLPQIKMAEVGDTLTDGGVLLLVTLTLAVDVQPFAPVTVTI